MDVVVSSVCCLDEAYPAQVDGSRVSGGSSSALTLQSFSPSSLSISSGEREWGRESEMLRRGGAAWIPTGT